MESKADQYKAKAVPMLKHDSYPRDWLVPVIAIEQLEAPHFRVTVYVLDGERSVYACYSVQGLLELLMDLRENYFVPDRRWQRMVRVFVHEGMPDFSLELCACITDAFYGSAPAAVQ